MPESAGRLADRILARVRDPHGLAHPRALVRRLIQQAADFINLVGRFAVNYHFFETEPFRLFYSVRALYPDIGWVVGVRLDGLELSRVEWTTLPYVDPVWFRAVASRPEAWARLGDDRLVIYPAMTAPVSLQLVFTTLQADLDADTTVVELPDDVLPLVVDAVELLLLGRARMFAPGPELMKALVTRIQVAATAPGIAP